MSLSRARFNDVTVGVVSKTFRDDGALSAEIVKVIANQNSIHFGVLAYMLFCDFSIGMSMV